MYGQRRSQPILLLIIFIALELILGFIPATHWADIGTALPATLIHIPVVLAGALLGSGSGALVGLMAGVCRMLNTGLLQVSLLRSPLFSPFIIQGGRPVASAWLSLLTSLIPFIAAGIISALVFRALGRVLRGNLVSLGLAGACGALIGALLMWGGIWANLGSLSAPYLRAMAVCTGAEALVALLACALPGTYLYHKFGGHDSY